MLGPFGHRGFNPRSPGSAGLGRCCGETGRVGAPGFEVQIMGKPENGQFHFGGPSRRTPSLDSLPEFMDLRLIAKTILVNTCPTLVGQSAQQVRGTSGVQDIGPGSALQVRLSRINPTTAFPQMERLDAAWQMGCFFKTRPPLVSFCPGFLLNKESRALLKFPLPAAVA